MRRVFATLLAGVLLNPGMIGAVPQHQNYGGTATPIKHLVVIFQENISFDHYFGTYPNAMNLSGENPFHPEPGTPTVNGYSPALLTHNPNLNPGNGTGATNPFRLSPAQAGTNDQDHNYTPEQEAYDGGLMDLFPEFTGTAGPPPGAPPISLTKGLTMGYYDGNTVTAYWNYAQHFSMSDNSFDTNFGPSTPGAINVISGQTNGVIDNTNGSGAITADGNGGFSDTGDADPAGDMCSTTTGETFSMSGQNIGDLLNAKGISWGFFSGGFNLSLTNANGSTGCARSTTSAITLSKKADYIPHHQPFQYYASTANPLHTRPASIGEIGHAGPANHQYDTADFFAAVSAGNLPAVSYLKAPGFQDGHAGYSDPIDEQNFVVTVINSLQKSRDWESTAVIIAYDDSDGWYDHVTSPLVNQSATASDQNTSGAFMCGSVASATATALPGTSPTATHAQGRCGYGPRQPFLVISPYAKRNYVDHATTDQSSVVRFIEDNWLGSERIAGSFDAVAGSINGMFDFERCREDGILILDPTTGEPKGPSFKF